MHFFFTIIAALLFTLNLAYSKDIEINISQTVNFLYNNANTVIVDIRRHEEWRETGIIDGSITSTLFNKNGTANLVKFLSDVRDSATADQTILLICRTGRRTKIATDYMLKNTEFQKVFSVEGGILEWKKKGHKIIAFP